MYPWKPCMIFYTFKKLARVPCPCMIILATVYTTAHEVLYRRRDRVWSYLTMYNSYLNRISRMAIVWNRIGRIKPCEYTRVNRTVIMWHLSVNPSVGCRTWERFHTIPYVLYTILTRLSSLVEWTFLLKIRKFMKPSHQNESIYIKTYTNVW